MTAAWAEWKAKAMELADQYQDAYGKEVIAAARAALAAHLDEVPMGELVGWATICIKGKYLGQFVQDEPNHKATNPEYWSDATPLYRHPKVLP